MCAHVPVPVYQNPFKEVLNPNFLHKFWFEQATLLLGSCQVFHKHQTQMNVLIQQLVKSEEPYWRIKDCSPYKWNPEDHGDIPSCINLPPSSFMSRHTAKIQKTVKPNQQYSTRMYVESSIYTYFLSCFLLLIYKQASYLVFYLPSSTMVVI